MPFKPKRPCSFSGCPNVTDHPRGYCADHLTRYYRQSDAERGTATERGYDARWQRAAKRYLVEHPLCVHCLKDGITRAAELVDHIIPHRGDMILFWDESNWQPLCKVCHGKKIIEEQGEGHQISTTPHSYNRMGSFAEDMAAKGKVKE